MLNFPSCELGFIVDLLWQKFGWFFGLARGFSLGFSGFLPWQTSLWCRCLNRGQHYKLAIPYSTAHVWFTCSTRVDGKGASPFFWLLLTPLVQLLFSPQLFHCCKNQRWQLNFHWENTEYSPTPTPTPALLAIEKPYKQIDVFCPFLNCLID